jgi:hypothetical protein
MATAAPASPSARIRDAYTDTAGPRVIPTTIMAEIHQGDDGNTA